MTTRRAPALALALALSLLPACHPHPAGPTPAGSTTYLHEVEVNDDAWSANWVGELRVGERIVIDGAITECCPDPFDGFALFAAEPLTLRLVLRETASGADLDLAVHLPATGDLVAAFETDRHPEVGVVDVLAPVELHAVVRSFHGDSGYRLELEALPLHSGLAAEEGHGPHAREVFAPYGAPRAR